MDDNLAQDGNVGEVQKSYEEAVSAIKNAILLQQVNAVQLTLYYSVGKFVSENSRSGYWKKGAIDYISRRLQEQLPGLRGFSATNIKQIRLFYEAWSGYGERSPDETHGIENAYVTKSSDASDDLAGAGNNIMRLRDYGMSTEEFNSISFSHHCAILNKVKKVPERVAKPMGVAVYKTRDEMPEKLRRALPSMEDLRKLL